MILNQDTLKLVFTEWILPEINYAVWLENGNPWSNVSLTVNQLMDTSWEFSLLHLLNVKKIKIAKLVMLNLLRLKKSEKKWMIFYKKKSLNAVSTTWLDISPKIHGLNKSPKTVNLLSHYKTLPLEKLNVSKDQKLMV